MLSKIYDALGDVSFKLHVQIKAGIAKVVIIPEATLEELSLESLEIMESVNTMNLANNIIGYVETKKSEILDIDNAIRAISTTNPRNTSPIMEEQIQDEILYGIANPESEYSETLENDYPDDYYDDDQAPTLTI